MTLELSGPLLHEDVVAFALQEDRFRRDTRARGFLAGKIHVYKHFGLEPAPGVIDRAANLDGAGCGINELGNDINTAGKGLAWKCAAGERELVALAEMGQ